MANAESYVFYIVIVHTSVIAYNYYPVVSFSIQECRRGILRAKYKQKNIKNFLVWFFFPFSVPKNKLFLSMTTLAYSNTFTPMMTQIVPEPDIRMKEEEEEKTIPFLR